MFLKINSAIYFIATEKGFKTDSQFYLIDFINLWKTGKVTLEIWTFQQD